eukprot:s2111_g5.t1
MLRSSGDDARHPRSCRQQRQLSPKKHDLRGGAAEEAICELTDEDHDAPQPDRCSRSQLSAADISLLLELAPRFPVPAFHGAFQMQGEREEYRVVE